MRPKFILLFAALGFCGSAAAQQLSDAKVKKEVLPLENSLEYLRQLEPVEFEYETGEFKKLNLPEGKQYGFVAEDLEKVLPGSVSTDYKRYASGKNAFKSASLKEVDMESLIPFLVGAIMEQQAQIDELKRQLAEVSGEEGETLGGRQETPDAEQIALRSQEKCSSCGKSCI